MLLWRLARVAGLALAGCGSDLPPPLPSPDLPTVVPDNYLVQSRACDGDVTNPLHQSDPITCRRFDFGRHQATENFVLPDGSVITTWGYAPFGPWVPPGDGGERLVTERSVTRIDSTEDGGTPFVVQFFVGARCGGTGWVAFRDDAAMVPQGLVARLNISRGDPNACTANSQAYTRYWRQTVHFPKLGAIDTIVGEHYNSASIARASALERFFWGYGWGRLVWQAFRTTASLPPGFTTVPDLPQRCPDFDGFNTLPQPGWLLVDCRESVNVEAADGHLTGEQLWNPSRVIGSDGGIRR